MRAVCCPQETWLKSVVISKLGTCDGFSCKCSSFRHVGRGLHPNHTSENTVSVKRFPCETLFSSGALSNAASSTLPHSKLISAPFFSVKSLYHSRCFRGEGTYQKHWSNIRPASVIDTCCRPLTSTVSPVKPKRRSVVSLKYLRNTPSWSINTSEPVSTIRCRHFPSISNVIEGAPCSNRTAVGSLSTFS